MAAIGWKPALALGHAEIDAQHQELFRRAAQLVDAMEAGDRAAVASLFDFLGAYIADHFAAEERLMTASQFPGYNVHRAVHQRFVRDYESLRQLHQTSNASIAVAIKARTWLNEWLTQHIGGTDVLLAKHLRQAPA